MSAIMTSRQAAELDHALERNGWTPELVKKLSQGCILSDLLPVLQGNAEVKIIRHVVDCSDEATSAHKSEVIYHSGRHTGDKEVVISISGDALYFHGGHVGLFEYKEYVGDSIKELHTEIVQECTLNICVLYYLIKHQELIPESWKEKDKFIFFWGTIRNYSSPCRQELHRSVPFLRWLEGKWIYDFKRIDHEDVIWQENFVCATT